MIASISFAGFGAIAFGYGMVRYLGGSASLSLVRLITHLTHSKQIVQISKFDSASSTKARLLNRAYWLYIPGLLFISSVGLGWDIYNADSPKASFFQPILHGLDVFSRPPVGTSPIVFSGNLIPALISLTVLAGIVPALVVPYFDKFKVTGVNWGPFHLSLLYSAVVASTGVGVILTLVGIFYRSLWMNRAPLPYHFGILTLLGFSLHFSLGMFIGMRTAEDKIIAQISSSPSGKLIVIA